MKIGRYHEPFLGGGSIFFSLPVYEKSFLSDTNHSLINAYRQVRDDVEGVIDFLRDFENSAEFYYEIRGEIFDDNVKSAAQFIYLNQTSFNGIYRVNLRGEYNVPYGHRKKSFLDEDNLRMASKKLRRTSLVCRDFSKSKRNILQGDLVFIDPPYTITHNNNGFIKYNETLFSLNDQFRLASFVSGIIEVGAYFIMTSAAHAKIKEIFDFVEPIEVERASLVGGEGAARGFYKEYVFTNLAL